MERAGLEPRPISWQSKALPTELLGPPKSIFDITKSKGTIAYLTSLLAF